MGALNLVENLTTAEQARRTDPKGNLADLIDVLSKEHGILQVATSIPCNNGRFHEDKAVASKPAGSWRGFGEGVKREAGSSEPIVEGTSNLNGLSEIDVDQLESGPGAPLAQRLQEDGLFLSGMGNTLATCIFSGNKATNPKQFTGINNRADYNTVDSDMVYDMADGAASATLNKTSMYIIQFGPKMVNLIYPDGQGPNGSKYGIKMKDYGDYITTDDAGNKYPVYGTWFGAHYGLFVHDYRCIKRIVNISTTNIDNVDDFSFDEEVLFDALGDLEHNGAGAHIVCNRKLWTQIRKAANSKSNAFFHESKGEGPFAKEVLSLDGIPIHREDTITNTQAKVA